MNTTNSITIKNSLLLPLLLTILFFVRKGIQYAILGRFIPLFLIGFVIGLLFYTYKFSKRKGFKFIVKTWSWLLIIWASVRLLFAAINLVSQSLSEHHLNQQLGIAGIVLSLTILILSIVMLIRLKKV